MDQLDQLDTLDTLAQPAPAASERSGVQPPRPICVDLDGSLSKSDTLIDSICALARQQPLRLLQLPGWLTLGKAGFKRELARHVSLDVQHLPYNQHLLQTLRDQKAAGHEIYLATGADQSLAERVAAHAGVFDGVFSSDGHTNLTGQHKLQLLQNKFGATGFDYIGNSTTDLPLLRAANLAALANPSRALASRLKAAGKTPVAVYRDRAPLSRTLRRTVRVQQWAKNALLFVPLLLAHSSAERSRVLPTLLAFVAFCLTASATYIVNDLLDIEADRRHPRKRARPFAAGDLSAAAGLAIATVFLAIAAGILFFEPPAFLFWISVYFVTTLAYSLYLKRIPMVDVLVLAGLYTVRILAGGAASQVPISPWLGGFSLFFFLSLAIVKRYSELHNLQARGATPANARGYLLTDLDQLRSFGTSSGYAAVIVFTFYINSDAVIRLYRHPTRLWLLAPILIYWISRIWLKAARGHLDEDPLVYAIKDRVSLALGVLTMLVLLGSSF
jgi:4-hydroxybenzoate polyprenyltransferase